MHPTPAAKKVLALYASRGDAAPLEGPLHWHDGDVLTVEELEGLAHVLRTARTSNHLKIPAHLATCLSPSTKARVARQALELQPLSGKGDAAWSLFVFGVFSNARQFDQLARELPERTSRDVALAKAVIAMLETRGDAASIRVLTTLADVSDHRSGKASQALERLLRREGGDPEEALDRAFVTDAAELGLRFEHAGLVQRPYRKAHLLSLLETDAAPLVVGQSWFQNGEPVPVSDLPLCSDADPLFVGQLPANGREIHERLRRLCDAPGKLEVRDWEALTSRGYEPGEYFPDANARMSSVRAFRYGATVELWHSAWGDAHPGNLTAVFVDSPYAPFPQALMQRVEDDLAQILGDPTGG